MTLQIPFLFKSIFTWQGLHIHQDWEEISLVTMNIFLTCSSRQIILSISFVVLTSYAAYVTVTVITIESDLLGKHDLYYSWWIPQHISEPLKSTNHKIDHLTEQTFAKPNNNPSKMTIWTKPQNVSSQQRQLPLPDQAVLFRANITGQVRLWAMRPGLYL